MNKKIIVLIVLAASLCVPNVSNAQKVTIGYRNLYQPCLVKFTFTVEGVTSKLEITGAKNNCQQSENAGCDAQGCRSASLESLVDAIRDIFDK